MKPKYAAYIALALSSLLFLTSCSGSVMSNSQSAEATVKAISPSASAAESTSILPRDFEITEVTTEWELSYRPATPLIAPNGSTVIFSQRGQEQTVEKLYIMSLDNQNLVTELDVKGLGYQQASELVRFSSDGRLAIIKGNSPYEYSFVELSTHFEWGYSAGLDQLTISPNGLWAAGSYPEVREGTEGIVRPMRIESTLASDIQQELEDFSVVNFGYSQDSKYLVAVGRDIETGRTGAIRHPLTQTGSSTWVEFDFSLDSLSANPWAIKSISADGRLAVLEDLDRFILIDFASGKASEFDLSTRSSGNAATELILSGFVGFNPDSSKVIFSGYPQDGESGLYAIDTDSLQISAFPLPDSMSLVNCGENGSSYYWADNCVRGDLLIQTEHLFSAEPGATNQVELNAFSLSDSNLLNYKSANLSAIGRVTTEVSKDLQFLIVVTELFDLAYYYSEQGTNDFFAEYDRYEQECADGESDTYNCDTGARIQSRIVTSKFVIERFAISN